MGILQYKVVTSMNVGRSVDETLRVLQAFQTGGLCPANWEPGQKTLRQGRRCRFRAEDGDQTVEARMARRDGRWRIFDIVLGPVSVIDLYRAQFDRIIRAFSYQELLRRMTNRRASL